MTQLDTAITNPLVKEQLTLLIEQELRYQLDDTIQKMQRLARDFQIGRQGKERSPLRNLLITAMDRTASIEVIKNYIYYQTTRSEDVGKVLGCKYDGKSFGAALIKALNDLQSDAETILRNIHSRFPKEHALATYLDSGPIHPAAHPQENGSAIVNLPPREVADLHLKLAQLYLGYLVREHTALRGTQGNSQSDYRGNQRGNRPQISNSNR